MTTEPSGHAQQRALSAQTLAGELEAAGVRAGDHLAVGISMGAIGRLEDGPDTVIQGLLLAVAGSGTVMLNAYTDMQPLRRLRRRPGAIPVFDRDRPANTGAVANRLLTWPGAVRSAHPTNSVVAAGAMAQSLTAGHDASAGAYSPYSNLAAIGGRFLALGIGDNLVGLRHEAQARAGLLELVPQALGALYRAPDGTVAAFRRRDVGGCIRRLPDLVREMRDGGFVRDGVVGRAEARLVEAGPALQFMTRRLEDHPERYLCDVETCLWCRTVEWRLDLYPRIERPAPFQRNRALRTAIAIENRARRRGRKEGVASRALSRLLRRAARLSG